MKKKTSFILMIIGLILIISSAILLIYTQSQEQTAKKVSNKILISLTDKIQHDNFIDQEETDTPVIDIDGQKYIGVIIIPKLDLELPIANTCSDYLLTQTPCAYTGDIASKDLIIAAHNYRAHFANIGTLTKSDEVYIMDTQGNFYAYELTLQEIIDENDIDSLNSGEWDLTLFTCLYTDDSQRVVLRFNQVEIDT